jgi:cytochrome P450
MDLARFWGSVRGVKAALAAHAEMCEYLRAFIARRRSEPRDDLLSALIAAEEAGDSLSDADVLATCQLLLVAGHETTTHLIGNGLLALLQRPEGLERLHAEPQIVPSAVEELLRFEGPIQTISRQALEEVEIDGKRVLAGQYVNLFLAAANRDPAQFSDPDRLDLVRADNKHLAFGAGIHYCLGAPLARLEAAVALGALARRFPRLRLAGGELEWQDSVGVRGLKSLPLAI